MINVNDLVKNRYLVTNIVDVWPGKQNGLDILVESKETGESIQPVMCGCPLAEWTLILGIQEQVDNGTLPPNVAQKILNLIDSYGSEKYNSGFMSAEQDIQENGL